MKTETENANKARRFSATRLLLMLWAGLIAGILLYLALGYGLEFLRIETELEPSAVSSAFVPPSMEGRMDINLADMEMWDTLPGIGPATARAILSFREQNGDFFFVEELLDVTGIGEKKLDAIRDFVGCPYPE